MHNVLILHNTILTHHCKCGIENICSGNKNLIIFLNTYYEALI